MSAAVTRALARSRSCTCSPFTGRPPPTSASASCTLPSRPPPVLLSFSSSPRLRLFSAKVASEPHLDTLHHQDTFHHRGRGHGGHDPSHQEAVNNLLYNTPPASARKVHRRTLCALVTNEAGVLSRVSGCLASRGVNIDSLVVSETETPGLSRMTIVLKGGGDVDQARKQLEDLVQVWAVVEFAPHAPVVERELLLVKLSVVPSAQAATASSSSPSSSFSPSTPSAHPSSPEAAITTHIQRQAIVELTELFGGRVLDLTPDFIMIELTGKSMRIDAFIELVRPFGIKELARSGALAMLRGAITGVGSREKKEEKRVEVDPSQLPPG